MKALFLDIDGVCNSRAFFDAQPEGDLLTLDPQAVAKLMVLLDVTGAEIVLTSTYRLIPELRARVEASLPVRSRTPRGDAFGCRSEEIAAWLSTHPDVTQFAILDDDADAGYDALTSHFVQTDPDIGLTAHDVVRVAAILQGN